MATSPRAYQNSFRKNANNVDITKRPKSMIKERDIAEEKKKNIKHWITFY